MTATAENPYLTDNFGPVETETTALDLPVTGTLPAHLDGRYLRNGPNPIGADRPGPLPLVPRRPAWCTASGSATARPSGTATGSCAPPTSRRPLGEEPRPGAQPHAGWDFRQHQRDRPRRPHLRDRRGRRPALRADRRARHHRPLRLRRHAARRLHRPPEARPATPASCTRCPTTGAGATRCSTRSSAPTAGSTHRGDIEVTGSPMMHDFSLTENHVVFYDLPVLFDTDPVRELLAAPVRGHGQMERGQVRRQAADAATPIAKFFATQMLGSASPELPLPLGPELSGARRRHAPRRRPRRTSAGSTSSPATSSTRSTPTTTATRSCSTSSATRRCSTPKLLGPDEGPPTLDRWTVDLTAGQGHRGAPQRHRPGVPPGRRAGGRAAAPLRLRGRLRRGHRRTACSTTTWSAAPRRPGTSGPARTSASSSSSRTPPTAAEDDGTLMGFVHDPATDRSDLMILDSQTLETVAAVHLPAPRPGRLPRQLGSHQLKCERRPLGAPSSSSRVWT